MSKSIVEAIREQCVYTTEPLTTKTHTVPTTVEVEVPVAVSERQIVAVLIGYFSRPGAVIARNSGSGCAFRVNLQGSDDRRCAVGVFIPDAVYDRVAEQGRDPEGFGPAEWSDEPELAFLAPHVAFLKACQSLHDSTTDDEGAPFFVAKLHGLEQYREATDPLGYTQVKHPDTPQPASSSVADSLGLDENVFTQGDSKDDIPF